MTKPKPIILTEGERAVLYLLVDSLLFDIVGTTTILSPKAVKHLKLRETAKLYKSILRKLEESHE